MQKKSSNTKPCKAAGFANPESNELMSIRRDQSGIALPLTLILLLAMTLVAIATLRTTTLEENMTANSRLRQIAFNAAETALREAETAVLELNTTGGGVRRQFFGNVFIGPKGNPSIPGDTCTGGYCTPARFTGDPDNPPAVLPTSERWEDPALDVWNDNSRHIQFTNLANSDLQLEGVFEPPKYIIEFMGNYDYKEPNLNSPRPVFSGAYVGNCRSDNNNELTPPNNVWPFCAADPAIYRITVRATAGPRARQAVVMLQSHFRSTGG